MGTSFRPARASKIVPARRETSVHREVEESKAPTTQPWLAPPVAIAISARERQIEQQNRQTGRILLDIMFASFFLEFLQRFSDSRKGNGARTRGATHYDVTVTFGDHSRSVVQWGEVIVTVYDSLTLAISTSIALWAHAAQPPRGCSPAPSPGSRAGLPGQPSHLHSIFELLSNS
jgi:hypothetical protein